MVYEHLIEVYMEDASSQTDQINDEMVNQLRAVRKLYPVERHEMYDSTTQESALLDRLWDRACVLADAAGSNGYVGSFQNCVLRLLYGVYGIDLLAFLFDRAWVPWAKIDPFRPALFLERLVVLERAAEKLRDGTKTPLLMPETALYVRRGMAVELEHFIEEKHRFLLTSSLRELRDFGELGLSLERQGKAQTVGMHIYQQHDEPDPEVMAFATEENIQNSKETRERERE
jgi:hypothetical protein